MRPIGFMDPPQPRIVESVGERTYVWTLRDAAGQQVECTIRLPRYVRDAVATHKSEMPNDDVVRACETRGESVIIDRVLLRGDPPMDWVVHLNEVVPVWF